MSKAGDRKHCCGFRQADLENGKVGAAGRKTCWADVAKQLLMCSVFWADVAGVVVAKVGRKGWRRGMSQCMIVAVELSLWNSVG